MTTVTLIGAGVPGQHYEKITNAQTWGEFKREVGNSVAFAGKVAIRTDDGSESEISDSDSINSETMTVCLTVTKQKAGK